MWTHNGDRDNYVVEYQLRPGTSCVVVSGQNWVSAGKALVRLTDEEERAVPLIAIGRDLYGTAELSQRVIARLRIETSSPPARLAIWSHSRRHSSDLLQRVLPKSLSDTIPAARGRTHRDPALLVESLASAALSGPLEEIALESLGGTAIQGDEIAVSIALLQHLALHPLHRSNKLGALVAALCQKRGTI